MTALKGRSHVMVAIKESLLRMTCTGPPEGCLKVGTQAATLEGSPLWFPSIRGGVSAKVPIKRAQNRL